jgi:glycosyltransferase involved in cell wall biosynthesis
MERKDVQNNRYPKVLIAGISFIPKTGSGITISNLFRGWPKEKLAVVNNIISNSDQSICTKYYQLNKQNKTEQDLNPIIINKKPNKFKVFIKKTLWNFYAGPKNYFVLKGRHKFLKIDNELLVWIKEFSPDIIYSMPRDIIQIPFLIKLQKITGIPLAVHIVDDWPRVNYFGFLNIFGKSILDRHFKKLLNKSSVLMSISSEMQKVYKQRYKRDFIPFHNPIDLEKWKDKTRNTWETKGIFKIMFAGTIEEYNIAEIENLCIAIRGQNDIVLNLYGSIRSAGYAESLSKYKNCHLKGLVSSETVFELLVDHDLLFLPLTFNKFLIENILISMPTKISEYMISGTPILLYSPEYVALTKYALQDNWAYIVSEPGIGKLNIAIKTLKEDTGLRSEIANRAVDVAKRNHDRTKIHDEFIRLLNNAIQP